MRLLAPMTPKTSQGRPKDPTGGPRGPPRSSPGTSQGAPMTLRGSPRRRPTLRNIPLGSPSTPQGRHGDPKTSKEPVLNFLCLFFNACLRCLSQSASAKQPSHRPTNPSTHRPTNPSSNPPIDLSTHRPVGPYIHRAPSTRVNPWIHRLFLPGHSLINLSTKTATT